MIVEPARAKLNLALHVRGRRPDGYHEIETLFAFVEAGDEVWVTPIRHPGESRDLMRQANGAISGDPGFRRNDEIEFKVTGPFATALAGEGDNLVLRAARAFAERFGKAGTAIELVKNLPVASGIGGGSADAAATLRALARLHGVEDDLFAIAEALGSDVPACLLCETAIGRGRGERLDPLPGLAELPVLLVNPGVAVPTGPVFAQWDGLDRGPLPSGAPLDIALQGRNDLQPAAVAIAPAIGEVLAMLDTQPGALLVRMSGSGATCFALFESRDARDLAASIVGAAQPGWWCCATVLA